MPTTFVPTSFLRRSRLALCALLCMPAALVAQAPAPAATAERLDHIAQSFSKDQRFMGVALVARGDQVLLDRGYGMASVEWQLANVPEGKFRLGSLTKQFTATLVLLLHEEGKIDLTQPIGTYLPDAPKAWQKITVADLLRQSSGIPNFTDTEEFTTWRMSPHNWAKEYVSVLDKPLLFAPGAEFRYSNSNYEVLGVLLEKVTGQRYGDLLRGRLLDPLGMKDTGLDMDGLVLPRRVEGYERNAKHLRTVRTESMTVPWAAGSMYSTVGDLLTWEHALFGGKVLKPESLRAMTTPYRDNYAYGVMVLGKEGDRGRVVTHEGGIEGFNTYLAYVPAQQICVAVLGNVNGSEPGELGSALLDTAIGKPVVLDDERKVVPLPPEALMKFVGIYQLAPSFTLTVAADHGVLTVQGTGQSPLPVTYEGLQNGHPSFFSREAHGSVEFLADANGTVTSLILHQGGQDRTAPKK